LSGINDTGKGAGYDLEVIEKLKESAGGNKPYVRASAVVGLDGLQKVVYNAVTLFSKRTLPVFDDIEKAKDLTQTYWICDSSKAGRELGYKQKVSIEDGIKRTCEWYKQMKWI